MFQTVSAGEQATARIKSAKPPTLMLALHATSLLSALQASTATSPPRLVSRIELREPRALMTLIADGEAGV